MSLMTSRKTVTSSENYEAAAAFRASSPARQKAARMRGGKRVTANHPPRRPQEQVP
jgi:hypothetical protein